MAFKEAGGLGQQMAVKVLPKFEHCRLADAGHQVGGKVLGNSLCESKNKQQNRYRFPGSKGRLGIKRCSPKSVAVR